MVCYLGHMIVKWREWRFKSIGLIQTLFIKLKIMRIYIVIRKFLSQYDVIISTFLDIK